MIVPYIFSLKINPSKIKKKNISLDDNYRGTNFCFDI